MILAFERRRLVNDPLKGHSRTLTQPSADALTPRALRTRGPGRVLVLSASGVRTPMRDVPSIQDKVLAALTARLSDD